MLPRRCMRPVMYLAATCLSLTGMLSAQEPRRPVEPKVNLSTDPLLHSFTFRSIGPAVMMGRLDDIQGSEKDPMLLYLGFATGGLWKSTDMGNHWKSLFDTMPDESIGAIGISPSDPNVVYVGTGEANNRQSASIGDGVWGTTDGGKTWTHLGLDKTQSINRIAVDPRDSKIVFVASPGHLFGPNPDRGLYRSTDGGKSWKLVKFIDENTGFNDVAIDPSNPKIVYASSFERRRTGWGYNGGGPNGALWKSTDGGNTWAKLDGPGWPKPNDGLYGRIAISIFRSNPKVLYAQVEAGASAGVGSGTNPDGTMEKPGANPFGEPPPAMVKDKDGKMVPAPPDPNGTGTFRSDDGGKTWAFLSNQDQRPTYFSQIRVDPKNVNKLFVGGTPGQMSIDGGKTWKGLTGSHTDYHAIWINPVDPRIVAVGHDGGLDISFDGGFTWDYHNDMALGQFYQVSADMRHPYFVCGGLQDNNAWCGPSALRSSTGPVNTDWYTVAGGDGFYTRQDPLDWGIVYAESQDGNMQRHDLRLATQKPIKPTATVPPPPKPEGEAKPADAAKPAETAAKTEDVKTDTTPKPATDAPAGEGKVTQPSESSHHEGKPEAKDAKDDKKADAAAEAGFGFPRAQPNVSNAPKDVAPFRFYWNAPFEIDPFDPSVVYMASQFFFKSTNRGDSWTMNPEDLSKNLSRYAADRPIMGVPSDKPMVAKHDGYSAADMATQLRVSPSRPGVIWIGTDDGNLQVSTDDGVTFTNVYGNIPGAPQGYVQVERIEPSHFDPGTAYVALDNHRNDDWAPYLYKTTDFGKTWASVVANLPPHGNINALREDLVNPDLLFVGTEFGLFVSTDGAHSWQPFLNGMPSVRVNDILIQPRDRDLIVGTHGRSIWIMDDITPLEQLKKTEKADLFLFEPRPAIQWKNDIQAQRHADTQDFFGENPQGGTAIDVYSKTDAGKAKIEFLQGTKVVSTMDVEVKAGINRYQWNMRGPAPAARPNPRRNFPPPDWVPYDPTAKWEPPAKEEPAETEVPFVAAGGGGFFRRTPQGPLVEPGTYMIRMTVAGKTLTSSVAVLEDKWLAESY